MLASHTSISAGAATADSCNNLATLLTSCLHGAAKLVQERCEPGVCKVARYHGPLVLELKPDIPGVPHASAERFKLGPACVAFQAAWQTRLSTGDMDLLAADGSRQRVHRLVLQCRLPVLAGQPLAGSHDQVCFLHIQQQETLAVLDPCNNVTLLAARCVCNS